MLKNASKWAFFIIFCEFRIDTLKRLLVKLAPINLSIFMHSLKVLREQSSKNHAHYLRWKIDLEVHLANFCVIPTIILKLISSNIGIKLLFNAQNTFLRRVFIVLNTLKPRIPGIVAQVLYHNLYNVISIWDHGNGYFQIVLSCFIVNSFDFKWFFNKLTFFKEDFWCKFKI